MKFFLLNLFILLGLAVSRGQAYGVSNVDSVINRQLEIVQEALEKETDSVRVAQELIRLGNLYTYLELYNEAIKQFHRAGTFLNPDSGGTLGVDLTLGMAELQIAIGDYELAVTLLEKMFDLQRGSLAPGAQAKGYGLLGICAEKRGEYLQALEWQEKSLNGYTMDGNLAGIARTEEHIGSIYEDLGQFELAYTHFEKAYTHYKGSRTREAAHLLNNLGDVRRKQGLYLEARSLTMESLEIAGDLGDYHQMQSGYKDLSKNDSALGDFEKAYKHLLQAEEYGKQVLNRRNTSQFNVLKARFENDRQLLEIQELQKASDVLYIQRWNLGVALALVLIFGTGISLYLFNRGKAALQAENARAGEMQAELATKERLLASVKQELELKTAALSRISLNLSHKNKILTDLSKNLSQLAARDRIDHRGILQTMAIELQKSMGEDAGWDTFMNIFEEIHPDFMKKLNEAADETLSPSELRLGMLLRMNLSSKEIASILRVTPDSVRVARHRLRKKLPIEHKKELVNFMVSL